MAASTGAIGFHTPYATSPGSSTPSPEVSPSEGTRELWIFFALALLNTAIIGVAGLATWLLLGHPIGHP